MTALDQEMYETIFSRIAQHAEKTPNAIAIQASGRQSLSYSRLRHHLQYVVEKLNGIGIGRNDRVVIVLPTGPEMAVASLAVVAGATAAPLNPEYKTAEFEFFLASLRAKLLLTQAGLKSPARTAAQAIGIPVLELSTARDFEAGLFDLSAAAGPAKPKLSGLAQPDDVALVLHTSGTTAQPKTVPLTQRNLWTSVLNLAKSLQLSTSDRCLHLLPLFHIGGLIDLLAAPLAVGGSVVCTSGFSVPEFFKCLAEFRPTWSQAVPTMLQEILAYAEDHRDIVKNNSLRLMRSVSAPLPAAVMKEFERVFNVPVIEIFGMTEAAGLISSNPLPPGKRKPGSVGVSAGPEVGIMGESGNLMPAKQAGEVVVRGENLMPGYEDAPAENARAFSGSWFRTGDQGYLDEEGYLFLTGRVKEIINRGGEKISPREVDEVLLTNPAVAEAATFALPHASLGEEVAVAVVLKQGAALSKQELIAFLGARLAYFKVPRVVHFIDEIPKGPSGKLQRNVLAQQLGLLDSVATEPKPPFTPPNTPIAKTLVEIWSRLLNVARMGIHDNFFDLGGDSLKAASFINELQQKWGAIVYVSAVFDAPSVAEFEGYLHRHYPELVARMLGQYVSPGDSVAGGKVDPSKVARLRQSIARLPGSPKTPREKNPPAILILCPPRSGSTLLRVMLGGSSKLFAPPELYLLSFDNLADRKAWFTGSQRFQLEGNIRGVMQIKNQDLESAQALLQELEERKMPTQEYYRMMQDWLGGRILVDKTPSYAIHIETLKRAEQYFDSPIYIHLLRHPYGMVRSFEEAKLEQLWYPRLVGTDEAARTPCPYNRRELAEMIWLILHQNILEFLEGVPRHRQYRVKFEDLVGDPRRTMDELCRFMSLDFEPEMLQPQMNQRERMTDGAHPVSRMIGDMKFHQHEGVVSEVADLWKQQYEIDFLSDETWQLAALLGYDQTLAKVKNRKEFEI
jgi:acyl-CoA synthetase (AMP-forming)/AMP-acid ligase II